jgi:hypothetical protein
VAMLMCGFLQNFFAKALGNRNGVTDYVLIENVL